MFEEGRTRRDLPVAGLAISEYVDMFIKRKAKKEIECCF